jgi:trehalose 6-phosphate synthase
MQVDSYRDINDEINGLIEHINIKYGNENWLPIIRFSEDPGATMRMASRVMADFYVVSSLHDGMNLVAKEFVASRYDDEGSLILSPFTGAADELRDAFMVNPYATDEFARTIDSAIKATREERSRRMRSMRSVVRDNNIYKWAADLITAMTEFENQPIRVG